MILNVSKGSWTTFGNNQDHFDFYLWQCTNLAFSDLEKFWVWKSNCQSWKYGNVRTENCLIKVLDTFSKGVGNRLSKNNATMWNASLELGKMEEEEGKKNQRLLFQWLQKRICFSHFLCSFCYATLDINCYINSIFTFN